MFKKNCVVCIDCRHFGVDRNTVIGAIKALIGNIPMLISTFGETMTYIEVKMSKKEANRMTSNNIVIPNALVRVWEKKS